MYTHVGSKREPCSQPEDHDEALVQLHRTASSSGLTDPAVQRLPKCISRIGVTCSMVRLGQDLNSSKALRVVRQLVANVMPVNNGRTQLGRDRYLLRRAEVMVSIVEPANEGGTA